MNKKTKNIQFSKDFDTECEKKIFDIPSPEENSSDHETTCSADFSQGCIEN